MTTTTFTDGWTYRTPLGPFAAAGTDAVEATPVRLPHDALRDADRFADAPSKGGAAYHPAGAYSYVKEFDVPAEWAKYAPLAEKPWTIDSAEIDANRDQWIKDWTAVVTP